MPPIDQNTMRFFNRVAIDDGFEGMGLSEDEGDRLAAQLGNKNVLMMGNHGVLVIGDSVADTFNRNVGGTVFTVQKTLPLLSPGASIVLAGSTAASRGTPAFGAYAASKAAIRSFGRTWATELADRGIRVNTVIPGPIMTPGLHGLEGAEGQRQGMLDGLASNPMKRIGDPEELAAAVVFLASDASSFMTGSEVVVDGGINQV